MLFFVPPTNKFLIAKVNTQLRHYKKDHICKYDPGRYINITYSYMTKFIVEIKQNCKLLQKF